MSLKNKSNIDMIQGPEFINLEPVDINPLMSKCEIKVFYLGTNRNGSYINRETAEKMAKTLRGTPIVAAYIKDKEDFGDHGEVIHIEDGKVEFSCKTIPYGFVSPDAPVWFQNFIDIDEFENKVERTYLMTTGFLWTGQFKELSKVIEEGQPHSMELDHDTLEGHWATDNNSNLEFFIITDAVFSKLCILGDDVEPCFEGSSVTSPEISKDFSLDQQENFSKTLYSMMIELQQALKYEGGSEMPENEQLEQAQEITEEETAVFSEEQENAGIAEDQLTTTFEENEDKDEFTQNENSVEESEPEITEEFTETTPEEPVISAAEYEVLNKELESLRAEVSELRNFKLAIENQQKDELINSYFMLSDEDKKEVIEHKTEFSLDEIKSKLAVIYVEKNVNFDKISEDMNDDEQQEEDPSLTFSLDDTDVAGYVPSFIEALRRTKKN